MLLRLLLLFCDLMSVNFDWSIFFIRKSFGASRHISEKLGVKLAIASVPDHYLLVTSIKINLLWVSIRILSPMQI